jgi:hypothetical protein
MINTYSIGVKQLDQAHNGMIIVFLNIQIRTGTKKNKLKSNKLKSNK